ncbi:MAG: SPOR domain-containing protein, partial [Nitrospinales bacterium]
PRLHEECGNVFDTLRENRRQKILDSVQESKVSEKWKKLKLFTREDVEALNRLKFRLGIAQSILRFSKDFFYGAVRLLKASLKKAVLNVLDLLTFFGKSTFRFRLVFLAAMVALTLGSLLAWKKHLQGNDDPGSASVDSSFELNSRSETAGSSKIHTIQIAAVTRKGQADRIVKSMRKKGVKGLYVVKMKRRAGNYWYKIRIEKFDNKKVAQQYADHLIEQKIIKNYFIISYAPQPP